MRLTPISTTETILDAVKAKLTAMEAESGKRFSQVAKFPGTNAEALLEFLPALGLPGAAIIYSGSGYANRPLRTLRVSVALVTEMYKDDDVENLRAHIDAVVKALDDQVSGQVLIRVSEDTALDLPGNPRLAASLVALEIQDH
ncbi:MAG: hypothetical protein PHP98_10555 [Kiritimatiellae bacterium]|nr:hypothetical protein [Kiritimatiellia bacterium]